MSREFGDCIGGFFHDKIRNAADDCKTGRDHLTKLWGEFLHEFESVAYQISNSEACDSGPDSPISETIRKIPVLKEKLFAVESFVSPFKRVADDAVRRALESK